MAEKFISLRVDENIHERYKKLCDELGLHMGKQVEILLRQFVDIQENNLKMIKQARKEK